MKTALIILMIVQAILIWRGIDYLISGDYKTGLVLSILNSVGLIINFFSLQNTKR